MSTAKVYQIWSSSMTQCLLSEIRHLCTKFEDGKYSMKTFYEEASAQLCEKGYQVTPYRVEKKWHNLVTTYRTYLFNKINTSTRGDETVTKKHEFYEELHDIMNIMNTMRGKSNLNFPSLFQGQLQSAASPQSRSPSPSPSPEPRRKRAKTEDTKQPQIILVPAGHTTRPPHQPQDHHTTTVLQQTSNSQDHHTSRQSHQPPDNTRQPAGGEGCEGLEEQEARREWREWKRQQEVVTVQREGNRILESIDDNLSAIRKSLEFIVQKLSNQ